jgi:hypothetical protein
MREKWHIDARPRRKAYVPIDDELAAFVSLRLTEDFWRWVLVSLLTGARPEAVLDLTPAQRSRDASLLELNPAGRSQNKKYRPTVREPQALTAWLDHWENEARKKIEILAENNATAPASEARYCRYASVESVQSAIEGYRGGRNANARNVVNVPRLSAYSFRHKVTTVLRKAKLSEDEIAKQLGHSREHVRITSDYGEWDPDYLTGVADALDAWWIRLDAKVMTRSLFPPIEPEANVVELKMADTPGQFPAQNKREGRKLGKHWSEREDSNLRPPRPERGALPG